MGSQSDIVFHYIWCYGKKLIWIWSKRQSRNTYMSVTGRHKCTRHNLCGHLQGFGQQSDRERKRGEERERERGHKLKWRPLWCLHSPELFPVDKLLGLLLAVQGLCGHKGNLVLCVKWKTENMVHKSKYDIHNKRQTRPIITQGPWLV